VVHVENWEESVVIVVLIVICILSSWMMLDDNIFIKFRCFHFKKSFIDLNTVAIDVAIELDFL